MELDKMSMKEDNQRTVIKAHLLTYGSIDLETSIREYDIPRLSDVILHLRNDEKYGPMKIRTVMVERPNGSKRAVYKYDG